MPLAMTREELIERLCELAAEQVSVDRTQVTVDSHFRDDLGFDSLDTVEFMMTIEDEFDVNVSDEVAADTHSVGQVMERIVPLME